jgi:hypothetical protein
MCDAHLCKLTSWVSDPVEKLMVVELAKFLACYGIRDFITELIAASHRSVSWARLIHATSFSCIYLVSTLGPRRYYTRLWLRRSELDPRRAHLEFVMNKVERLLRFSPWQYHYLSYTLIHPSRIHKYFNIKFNWYCEHLLLSLPFEWNITCSFTGSSSQIKIQDSSRIRDSEGYVSGKWHRIYWSIRNPILDDRCIKMSK